MEIRTTRYVRLSEIDATEYHRLMDEDLKLTIEGGCLCNIHDVLNELDRFDGAFPILMRTLIKLTKRAETVPFVSFG